MTSLKRLWFEFERKNFPTALNLGFGITAFDYKDAVKILRTQVFIKSELPTILRCEENIDISTLDERHIRPNMRPPNLRGVWFPLGYE